MEKAFIFMCRLRIPGGELTPAQWLKMDDIAHERANGTIRLTTRQTIQFHGIIKSNLKPAIRAIHDAMLDTIAACGDVNRGVICSANPYQPALRAEALALARELSGHLLPRTRAWHEIWVDEEQVVGGEEEEPILGRTYLPRKFKIAITVPPLNDVDVFAHEIGLIAIVEEGAIAGYNVVVGGGMGMTHGQPDTFPRTGDVIGFCRPEQVVDVAREDRHRAARLGRPGRPQARPHEIHDRAVWPRDGSWPSSNRGSATSSRPRGRYTFDAIRRPAGLDQGRGGPWHYTVFVENGRVHDLPGRRVDDRAARDRRACIGAAS